MKRIFSLLVLFVLFLSVFGCAQKATIDEEVTENVSPEVAEISSATEEASDDSELNIASEEDDLGDII